MSDTLIVYYSRKGENYWNGNIKNLSKGNTEIVAEMIADITGGDLFQVETVKAYPDDYPFPSCLVMGTIDKMKLHVVLANDGSCLRIISAYRPDDSKFMEDGKTRR